MKEHVKVQIVKSSGSYNLVGVSWCGNRFVRTTPLKVEAAGEDGRV